MKKAFAHTAAYDAAIAEYLTARAEPGADPEHFPGSLAVVVEKVLDLRYGENPHQAGAFYRAGHEPDEPTVAFARVLQGKELSYNNLLDLEAALNAVKEFDETACVVVKHNTPCGVALAGDARRRPSPGPAPAIRSRPSAASWPSTGRSTRPPPRSSPTCSWSASSRPATTRPPARRWPRRRGSACSRRPGWRGRAPPGRAGRRRRRELRSVNGGLLVMDRDLGSVQPRGLQGHDAGASPPSRSGRTCCFAWKVVKHVKSNAIVFARGDQTVAIGGGQTSRVESVKTAVMKAQLR